MLFFYITAMYNNSLFEVWLQVGLPPTHCLVRHTHGEKGVYCVRRQEKFSQGRLA